MADQERCVSALELVSDGDAVSDSESEKSLAYRASGFQLRTGAPVPAPLPRLLNRRRGAWAATWRIASRMSSACDRPVAAASCRRDSTSSSFRYTVVLCMPYVWCHPARSGLWRIRATPELVAGQWRTSV
jgi:hypothetical protein